MRKSQNDTATEINDIVLHAFQTEKMEHKSLNLVLQVNCAVYFPIEYFNSQNPPGFPPHVLIMKIGKLKKKKKLLKKKG